MQITESEKLERDLETLLSVREVLAEAREKLEPGRRGPAAWLRLRLTMLIRDIDTKVSARQKKMAWEMATERLMKGAGQLGGGEMWEPAARKPDDSERDAVSAADDGGCVQEAGRNEYQRFDTAAGVRGQLGKMEMYPGIPAGGDQIPRKFEIGCSASEALLRQRLRERKHGGLREWQRQIMEADRLGKHERLEI